jgi:hypothetical protein
MIKAENIIIQIVLYLISNAVKNVFIYYVNNDSYINFGF